MGSPQQVESTPAGFSKTEWLNLSGLNAQTGLEAGPAAGSTGRMFFESAGNGWVFKNVAGAVVFTIDETGAIAPGTFQLPQKATDPAAPEVPQIYMKTPENTLKFFDGTSAFTVVTTSP